MPDRKSSSLPKRRSSGGIASSTFRGIVIVPGTSRHVLWIARRAWQKVFVDTVMYDLATAVMLGRWLQGFS